MKEDKFWNTGALVGSGNYVGIDYDHEHEPYSFYVDDPNECDLEDLLAWHKIPPYKEQI